MSDRPETGPMQFGDDWPGLFIRGDNAVHLGVTLEALLNTVSPIEYSPLVIVQLRGLAHDLQNADIHSGVQAQKLLAFEQCKEMK